MAGDDSAVATSSIINQHVLMQAYGQDQMRMDDSSCTKHVGI